MAEPTYRVVEFFRPSGVRELAFCVVSFADDGSPLVAQELPGLTARTLSDLIAEFADLRRAFGEPVLHHPEDFASPTAAY
jgi:hypothetical protein